MRCPYCGKDDDKVVDTRSMEDGKAIRRRRLCLHCQRRFITLEEIEDKTLYVVKSDSRREPYDRKKLTRSLQLACTKRPISVEQIEQLVDQIETDIRSLFVKEISSRRIGEMVITSLRQLDEVAYVRFASVYRNFRDKEEFLKELNQLSQNKQQEP